MLSSREVLHFWKHTENTEPVLKSFFPEPGNQERSRRTSLLTVKHSYSCTKWKFNKRSLFKIHAGWWPHGLHLNVDNDLSMGHKKRRCQQPQFCFTLNNWLIKREAMTRWGHQRVWRASKWNVCQEKLTVSTGEFKDKCYQNKTMLQIQNLGFFFYLLQVEALNVVPTVKSYTLRQLSGFEH